MDQYQALANAIVLQAVRDWREAVHKLKNHPDSDPAKEMKAECEEFFLSGWFAQLTDLNGKLLLRKLQKEAGLR